VIRLEQLIICDDARPERHNKISFMGVYFRDILLRADKQWKEKGVIALPRLTFVVALSGVDGVTSCAWSLINPDGTELVPPQDLEVGSDNQEADKDSVSLMVISWRPAAFRQEGEYTFKLSFDEQSITHTFNIRVVEQLPA